MATLLPPVALGPVRLGGLGPPRAPRARLGQEIAPENEIIGAVHTVAAALALQTAQLKDDYELAADGRGFDIPMLGALTNAEALLAIADVAQELAAIGSSILEGALKNYVDQNDHHTISLDIQKALKIGRDARDAAGGEEIRPGYESDMEAYFLAHVQDLRDLRDAAEQLVVIAENGAVPVREPGEEHAIDATATLVAVGLLVTGGLVWLAVS